MEETRITQSQSLHIIRNPILSMEISSRQLFIFEVCFLKLLAMSAAQGSETYDTDLTCDNFHANAKVFCTCTVDTVVALNFSRCGTGSVTPIKLTLLKIGSRSDTEVLCTQNDVHKYSANQITHEPFAIENAEELHLYCTAKYPKLSDVFHLTVEFRKANASWLDGKRLECSHQCNLYSADRRNGLKASTYPYPLVNITFTERESLLKKLLAVPVELIAGGVAGGLVLLTVLSCIGAVYQRKAAWTNTTPDKTDPLKPLLIEITAAVHEETLAKVNKQYALELAEKRAAQAKMAAAAAAAVVNVVPPAGTAAAAAAAPVPTPAAVPEKVEVDKVSGGSAETDAAIP